MDVRVRRVREEAAQNDGARVLVDRIWPRGVAKADVRMDAWIKSVAPSSELRAWYGHEPAKFDEFARRYRKELDTDEGRAALQEVRDVVRGKRLTLLTDTRDVEHSQAAVLAALLRG